MYGITAKRAVIKMDIKLLTDGNTDGTLIPSYAALTCRKTRRECFRRAAYLSASSVLLFICFGCFYSIYAAETGKAGIFLILPSDLRSVLKLFTVASFPPLILFAFAFTPLSGAVCFCVCALCGGVYGALMMPQLASVIASPTPGGTVSLICVSLAGVAWCAVCALFSAVSYSYRRSGMASYRSDTEDYIKSLMTALSLILLICLFTLLCTSVITKFK